MILILSPLIIWGVMPFEKSIFLINSLKYINCLLFIWMLLSTLLLGKKIYHPYFLFLISFFTFLISRVFFDVLSSDSMYNLDIYNAFGMEGIYSMATQVKLQLLLLIGMLFGHLGALIAFKNTDKFQCREWKYDKKWGTVGLFLFWIFLLPAVIYYFEQVCYLLEVGYKELLATKTSIFVSSPFIFRLSDDFFYLGFILFLAAKPSWKKLVVPVSIFILMLLFRSILGARVIIFTQMLMLVTYLGYRHFIKARYVILIGFFLLGVSSVVSIYRTYSYYGGKEKFSLNESVSNSFVSDFFQSQNITLEVVSMALEQENRDKIKKSVFPFFYPAIRPFISLNYSIIGDYDKMNSMNKQCYLADKLSIVILGENAVVNDGEGLGSSYILEFYFSFGIFGFALGCFLCFFMVLNFIEKYINHVFCAVFILISLPMFFYMPRASFMSMIEVLIQPTILFLFIILITNIISRIPFKFKN